MRASLSGALVAVLLVGAAACAPMVPPTPVPIPACPVRQSLTLEPPDLVNFSLPRAVSATGDWMVTSRSIASEPVLSLRATQQGSASQLLGTLHRVGRPSTDGPLVSIAQDGSQVLFGYRGNAAVDTDTQADLYRWSAATHSTTTVPLPVVATPPVGVAYPVNLYRLSADGQRIFWTQSFYEAPFTFQHVMTVTDAVTDAVIAQFNAPSVLFESFVSSGGHQITTPTEVINVDTGVATSLAYAKAQILIQLGVGGNFASQDTSDNGKFTVFARQSDGSGGPAIYLLWNHLAQTLSEIDRGALNLPTAVTDDGRVLYTRVTATSRQILVGQIDETPQVIASGTLLPTWPEKYGPYTWTKSSVDLRTVLYSQELPLLGYRLTAQRCA
jgi:hypothetical protein